MHAAAGIPSILAQTCDAVRSTGLDQVPRPVLLPDVLPVELPVPVPCEPLPLPLPLVPLLLPLPLVPLLPPPLVPLVPLVPLPPVPVPIAPLPLVLPVPAAPLAPVPPLLPVAPEPLPLPLPAPELPLDPLASEPLLPDLLFFCFCFCFWSLLPEPVLPLAELPELCPVACEPDWPAVLLDCAAALNDTAMAAATEALSIAFNNLCNFILISWVLKVGETQQYQ